VQLRVNARRFGQSLHQFVAFPHPALHKQYVNATARQFQRSYDPSRSGPDDGNLSFEACAVRRV
jgi:hypothetical protein